MTTSGDSRAIFEEALRAQVRAGCPGAILEVSAPKLGFTFSGAQGVFARGDSRPLCPDAQFRIASVTKAFTAATAVRLAANGRWQLDAPITRFLAPDMVKELSRLEGLTSAAELTIRRLLSHTSGLPDYFFDAAFQARVKADPDRLWRPEELVSAAVQAGPMLFAPGSDFSYGDTGYVLVGIAIERLLECSLADAYRTLVLDPLHMDATYMEWREPPSAGEMAHHYDGDLDLYPSNLSFDWAGGGLVSTARDLVRFLHGLFGGDLFGGPWRAEMMNWRAQTRWRPHSSARYVRYGLGLGTNWAYGEEIIGATGVWGGFAYYWPAGDAAIAGTLNSVGADRPALVDAVIAGLQNGHRRRTERRIPP